MSGNTIGYSFSTTGERMLLAFFEYDPEVRGMTYTVSHQFYQLAHLLAATLPVNEERVVALRKLLEARDAAIRSSRYDENQEGLQP
jgi:hypothetical protein